MSPSCSSDVALQKQSYLLLLHLRRDDNTIPKLRRPHDRPDLKPTVAKQLPPVCLFPLERLEHGQHGDAQTGRVLDASGTVRLLIRQDLLVDQENGVGTHGGEVGSEDAEGRLVGVVVEDLTEVVDSCALPHTLSIKRDENP